MENFFGSSKSSLQETLRLQESRLLKYEKKLGDLVKAYKILQEEKNALQGTVNVLSCQPDTEGASEENVVPGDETLRQQVSALTKTIASLNDTKNTLEVRFQNDKKELLDKLENYKCSLSAEETCSQKVKAFHEGAVQDMRNKIRHEQHEREQEQTHHVAMLRELQHMLAAERNSNQRLELELDEVRSNRSFDKQRGQYEDKYRAIRGENERLSAELAQLTIKLELPTKAYLMLESEVVNLRKSQEELELSKNSREQSAYKQLNLQTSADQSRIRSLESRLTELSELIADYDSTQKHDREEITRLQHRVTSLESLPPKTETKSVHVSVNTNIVVDGRVEGSPVSPTTPVTLTTPVTPTHRSPFSQQPVVPLMTKNREAEISKLRDSLRIFKQEIRTMQEEKRLQHQNFVRLTEDHRHQLQEISVEHAGEIAELDKGHVLRLSELQDSSKSARVRSQQLLEEKDEEIRTFKAKVEVKSNRCAFKDGGLMCELLSSVETEDVPRTLVFYKQQYKFLTDEISLTKKNKDTVELILREKEANEHVYVAEISQLKANIRRLIRNSSRESANLEYLKNIMLRYLRATVSSEKRQILLAIFTILEFSVEEKESVKHKLAPAWFS